jgi:hypothetical protein
VLNRSNINPKLIPVTSINKECTQITDTCNNNNSTLNNTNPISISSNYKRNDLLLNIREREKLFNFFLNHFLTKDKSANIINSILDKMQTIRINQNQYLFKEGDKSNMFYIIKQGVFEMYRENSESDKKTLKAYDTFGEMALLELKRRTHTVKCKEGGVVYAWEGKIFKEVVRQS